MESSSRSRKTRGSTTNRADNPHQAVTPSEAIAEKAAAERAGARSGPLRREFPAASPSPEAGETSAEPLADAAAERRRLLRTMRVEAGGRLSCINHLCHEILHDELCLQLAEEAGQQEDDFVATLQEVREICARGATMLVERFAPHDLSPDQPAFLAWLSDEVHDFKNCVAGIKYACDILLQHGNERFLPFEETIQEIREHFDACMAVLASTRAKFHMSEPGGNGSAASPIVAPAGGRLVLPEVPDYVLPAVEPGHILVVDDDRTSREYLAKELEKHGHRVTLAEDGRQAIELLQQTRYSPGGLPIDLVLLDLWMRDVDGLTVLAEMKKDYGLRSIPVVMVSAHDEINSVVMCISYGADDYLTKPYEPRILQARVNSCLAKAELHRQERVLNEQVRAAKLRADNLLYDIFPYTVAEELITSGTVKPRGCENVAVLFCDVVGFTPYCDGRSPAEIVASLHELFTAYDQAIRQSRVERIKTIGDCMMVTAGVAQRFENPVLSCIECGQKMIEGAAACSTRWSVRVGIHVGPVVAGMAGNRQYAFDVWGDTVNTASRIEAIAEANTIAVSEPAWSQVFERCKGHSLGVQPLKGRRSMEVFRFEGFR